MNGQPLIALLVGLAVFGVSAFALLKFMNAAKLDPGVKAFVTLILGMTLLGIFIILFLGLKITITI